MIGGIGVKKKKKDKKWSTISNREIPRFSTQTKLQNWAEDATTKHLLTSGCDHTI